MLTLTSMIVVIIALHRDRFVRQRGRARARARRTLTAEIARWPEGQDEGVVRWHDVAALTKQDVVTVLSEHGWFYRDQDMDADGWRLFVTRDARSADTRYRPPADGSGSPWRTSAVGESPGADSAQVRSVEQSEGPPC